MGENNRSAGDVPLKLSESLLSGSYRIGIWGTGYIGFTTMAYFASKSVHTIGTDVDEQVVMNINFGKIPIPNLEYWLGFPTKPLVDTGLIKATPDWKELIKEDVKVHMVCIPTEKEGEPWDDPLVDVCKKIAKQKPSNPPTLVIIESTLTPGRSDDVTIPIFEKEEFNVGQDILIGVAPRRDWFISPEKSLENLPRVVGGTSKETTEIMIDVLSIVCENLLAAPSNREAEMVKSVENMFRHVGITVANQLAVSYPDIDIREVLRLVGTKWNIETYKPSFGTGGYCIPLSSKYVLGGTMNPARLEILKKVIEADSSQPDLIADLLVRKGSKNIGLLGLAYKSDLKIHILSPALRIAKKLKEYNISFKVHDPYYSDQEIRELVDAPSFKFPEGLEEFDALAITPNHRLYEFMPKKEILQYLRNCKLILDDQGSWERWRKDFANLNIDYRMVGDRNWLS